MPTIQSHRVLKLSAFVFGFAALAGGSLLLAQAQPAPGGTGAPPAAQPAPGSDGERQQRINQFRQMAENRIKDLLKATDDEWGVLKPRIEKLQQMQSSNDTRRVGFSMLMGGANASWRTQGSAPADGQRQANTNKDQKDAAKPATPGGGFFGDTTSTPAYEKAREMQTALEAKDATSDTLRNKLTELRAARALARTETTRAQEELRQLCSIRQEAVLVMMGILE